MPPNDEIPTQGVTFPGAGAADLDIALFLITEIKLPYDILTASKVIGLLSKTERRETIVKACADADFERVRQGKNPLLKDGGVRGGTNSPPKQIYKIPFKDHGDTDDHIMWALEDSFERKYVGAAVSGLYEYLENNNRLFEDACARETAKKYYGRFCSIVQSSGTGKSRAMIELRTKGVIVLYMNLRDRREEYTFPERDDIIADILTAPQLTGRQCYALFTAIFRVLKFTFEVNSLAVGSARELINHWNDVMCTLRSEQRNKWFQELQRQYVKELEADLTSYQALVEAFKAWNDFASERLGLDLNPNHPQLVIEFDEAHTLNNGQDHCPSHLLCDVISDYSKISSGTWVIFTSTRSRVSGFSPPFHGSWRSELVFPPYIHLGWDQHAKDIRLVKPKSVAQFKYIVRLGRPLWVSLMGVMIDDSLLNTAAQKLCNNRWYNPKSEWQALAMLGARFCITLRPGHLDSNWFNINAVASHMRILESITPNRARQSTIYPSEPLLACVAAQRLHQTSESLCESLKVLNNKVLDQLIDTGNGGEFFGRLLLLLAKDLYRRTLTTQPNNILTNNNELLDCVPIPVVGYLRFMFGENIISEDEKRLDGWYINFTHWISMASVLWDVETELSVRPDFAELHYYRTSAAQCSHDQPLVDKVIPIFYRDSSTLQSRFSHILISDRARNKLSKNDLESITHKTIFGYESTEPYVVILLDISVLASESAVSCECEWGTSSCGPCRIYVPGVNATSFSFLKDYPDILAPLTSMINAVQAPDPTPIISKLARQTVVEG
ncbi:hypothetical protein CTheo_4091 [Ceratobasidium theobromae]|uniref:Uncharacterized protein n=1 Tax=Ceratobasidium theobromae TaxID=1582974 RepID=A0A5N5QLA2_9AGAM|nr:hypothetical protein CTheo_4091 [Ceratobasidium theobromae]